MTGIMSARLHFASDADLHGFPMSPGWDRINTYNMMNVAASLLQLESGRGGVVACINTFTYIQCSWNSIPQLKYERMRSEREENSELER